MNLYLVFEIQQRQEVIGGHIGPVPESAIRVHYVPVPIQAFYCENYEEACVLAAKAEKRLGDFAVVEGHLMSMDFTAKEVKQLGTQTGMSEEE